MKKIPKLILVFAFISSAYSPPVEAYPGGVEEYCDADLGCFRVCSWNVDPDTGKVAYTCGCDCERIQ